MKAILAALLLASAVQAEPQHPEHPEHHRKHHHRRPPEVTGNPTLQVPPFTPVTWRLPPGVSQAQYEAIQSNQYSYRQRQCRCPNYGYGYGYGNGYGPGYVYQSPWTMQTLSPDIPGYREPSPFR